jgi:hypothetical protein
MRVKRIGKDRRMVRRIGKDGMCMGEKTWKGRNVGEKI